MDIFITLMDQRSTNTFLIFFSRYFPKDLLNIGEVLLKNGVVFKRIWEIRSKSHIK